MKTISILSRVATAALATGGILLPALTSCSNMNRKAEYEIVVEYSDSRCGEQFDSLFLYSHHIVPQTTEESLLGKINKVFLAEDRIYIMDDNSRVAVFDKEGGYIRSYSHRGNGRGEYPSLYDFDIYNDTLYLMAGTAIHKYTLDDRFAGTINLRNASRGMAVIPAGISLNNGFGVGNSSTADDYSYSFLKPDGEMINEIPFNPALRGFVFTFNYQVSAFSKGGDKLLTYFPYDETVYRVDYRTGNLIPHVDIRMGERDIDKDSSQEDVERILSSDQPNTFYAMYEWEDRISFSYSYGSPVCVVATLEGEILMNGIIGTDGNGIPVSLYGMETESPTKDILSIVSAPLVKMIASKKDDLSKYPTLKEISESIDDESNPVLIFYTPKWILSKESGIKTQ